jgi:hypothetical protein
MQAVDDFTPSPQETPKRYIFSSCDALFTNDIISFNLKGCIAREERIDHTGRQGTRAMTKRCIP